MSNYNQYSGYGGNPYEDQQRGGYGASNPYASDNSGNPYGSGGYDGQAQNYSANDPTAPAVQGNPVVPGLAVEYVAPSRSVMSNSDFLSRVEAVKADIRTLTTHVGQIAAAHQRTLSSPDTASSAQLESMITQTQVLNTTIKDQIKALERDAAQSQNNNVKNTQVGQLKSSFNKQLQEYRVEELNYEKRYREQIARQYRIVNPEATEQEVKEASEADWGNEGVFQTAVSIPTGSITPFT
jgi:syntaxin 1B/2/3